MKSKNRKRRSLKYFFFTIILAYFIIKTLSSLAFNKPVTEIVQYGQLDYEREYECIVVRQESIIKSPKEGIIKYFVAEGEKIPKGYKIAEIYTSDFNDEDKKELETLNNRIEKILSENSSIFDNDINKLNAEIDNIITGLTKSIYNGNYYKVSGLKKELTSKLEKKELINGSKSFSGNNLENLKNMQRILMQKISDSVIEINSPKSGIISYYIDGFEDLITIDNLKNINLENIKSFKTNFNELSSEKVIYNQPILKVVDNTSWYIGIITDDSDLDNFKPNKELIFVMGKQEINGKVLDIISNNNKNIIVVKVNEYLKDFDKLRLETFNVIIDKYTGLKIHKDSIIEKDGKYGVYVLDVNKRALFKPIKILGHKDETVIIKDTFFYEILDGETIKVNTVKLYDEILRNAKEYLEGDLVL